MREALRRIRIGLARRGVAETKDYYKFEQLVNEVLERSARNRPWTGGCAIHHPNKTCECFLFNGCIVHRLFIDFSG